MYGSQMQKLNHFYQAGEKRKVEEKERTKRNNLEEFFHYSWASLSNQEMDVPKTSRQLVTILNIREFATLMV